MTDNTAPDITTGFIQMVEAFKAKPELEQRIKELEEELENRRTEVARLADNRDGLEHALSVASEDKARLTRERDEAMFRTIELEEKTSQVATLLAQLDGVVRPEPVAKAEAPVSVPEPSQSVGHVDWKDTTDQYRNLEGSTSQGQGNVEESRRDVENFEQSIKPNAEQRSNAEDQYRDFANPQPNWNSPTKSEQNASEQPMGDTNVSDRHGDFGWQGDLSVAQPEHDRHPNHGKPYADKPWWVNDNDWRSQGG